MGISISTVSEDIALFGRTNRDTLDYVRDRNNRTMEQWTSRARERYEHTRDHVLKSVSMENFSRKLEAAARITRSKFRDDAIRRLSDIGDIQNAPSQMLKYLAANPMVRTRMRDNQCDGWSDRYKDDTLDRIGEDHYYYRRATNGLFRDDADGKLTATSYFERLDEGDRELTIDRQEDIMFGWEMLEECMKLGKDDPTSKWNAKLT